MKARGRQEAAFLFLPPHQFVLWRRSLKKHSKLLWPVFKILNQSVIRIVIKNCAFDITAHVIASEAKQSLFAEFEIATAIFNGLAMTLQCHY